MPFQIEGGTSRADRHIVATMGVITIHPHHGNDTPVSVVRLG
jgi:hypothetical protein